MDERLSPATKDFIKRCLGTEESLRASWEDVFRHQLFKGYFDPYF